jgi:hypothetical protein
MVAIKICGQLSKGLRKNFEIYAKDLAPALIPRFKERKLIEDTHYALDNFIEYSLNLGEIIFDISAGLKDKAPSTKKNTAAFLEKSA